MKKPKLILDRAYLKPRYVAYYRVSTGRQGRSGLGIEAQREAVRSFLQGTNGYPPVAVFTETEKGRKVDRVQLEKALAACRAHRATLIIAKLDRLARNAAFLMRLYDSGVDVQFCDLPQIPKGAVGRFLIQQMANVAELEAGLIGERTKAALAAKVARDGQWDRKASHHLVPGAGQAKAAEAVRLRAEQEAQDMAPIIAELRANRITSIRGIAGALNDQSISAPRGGRWSVASVARVLERIGR